MYFCFSPRVSFLMVVKIFFFFWMFSSVQSLSCVQLFATPWTTARQTSLSITNSQSLLRLMSIELMMPSNHLILYRPLLLLPSVFLSIGVFSNESVLRIRWLKYWSFGFSISPSNEYSGLISFRVDWLDLLSVRGTLKSLFQHYSFWCGPFLKSLLDLWQHCFWFFCGVFFFFFFFGMCNLSSLTRDQTHTPCIGWQSLNSWTIREVLLGCFFFFHFYTNFTTGFKFSKTQWDFLFGHLSS